MAHIFPEIVILPIALLLSSNLAKTLAVSPKYNTSGVPAEITLAPQSIVEISIASIAFTFLNRLNTLGSILSFGAISSLAPPDNFANCFIKYSLGPLPMPTVNRRSCSLCPRTRSKICSSFPTWPSVMRTSFEILPLQCGLYPVTGQYFISPNWHQPWKGI